MIDEYCSVKDCNLRARYNGTCAYHSAVIANASGPCIAVICEMCGGDGQVIVGDVTGSLAIVPCKCNPAPERATDRVI